MRIIIMIGFVFTFSNIYAQNELSSSVYHKTEMKFVDEKSLSELAFDQPVSHKHSFINLSGQAVVGTGLAVCFAIPPMYLGLAIAFSHESNSKSVNALMILGLSSYLFGAAVGVHWVAKAENKELSFWKTVGYSFIGGGVTAVLLTIFSTQYEKNSDVGGTIAALCPIISSMIYASFISDWAEESQKASFYKKNIFHNDLIEQTKLFNLELVRIKL